MEELVEAIRSTGWAGGLIGLFLVGGLVAMLVSTVRAVRGRDVPAVAWYGPAALVVVVAGVRLAPVALEAVDLLGGQVAESANRREMLAAVMARVLNTGALGGIAAAILGTLGSIACGIAGLRTARDGEWERAVPILVGLLGGLGVAGVGSGLLLAGAQEAATGLWTAGSLAIAGLGLVLATLRTPSDDAAAARSHTTGAAALAIFAVGGTLLMTHYISLIEMFVALENASPENRAELMTRGLEATAAGTWWGLVALGVAGVIGGVAAGAAALRSGRRTRLSVAVALTATLIAGSAVTYGTIQVHCVFRFMAA